MMSSIQRNTQQLEGLSPGEVPILQQQYGKNVFKSAGAPEYLHRLKSIISEPMFILLVIASILYFVLGQKTEGLMMAVAIGIVVAISVYQEVRSSIALQSLQQYTEPRITVIRGGVKDKVMAIELVPGDIILLEEGMKVPADAIIVQANDLSVNESVITGESLAVEKNEIREKNNLYQDSTINSGKCIARITKTGNDTMLGRIGKAVSAYQGPKTLLQLQINRFVKKMAVFGFAAFAIIFVINYLHYGAFVTSLLFALTLAMSAIPEEIPVAFSSFMALGAYKMSKLGIISRQPQVIESLGAVTVLCLDKTGTLTENSMELKCIYNYESDRLIEITDATGTQTDNVLGYGMLASEVNPFDPMEKAILDANTIHNGNRFSQGYKIVYEYPLEGHPPMMTHVYSKGNEFIAAAKGAAERIIAACKLNEAERNNVNLHLKEMTGKGYRVLAVCKARLFTDNFPEAQDAFDWRFAGLLALYDPPRRNVAEVLNKISKAKIDIKVLTGDYPETAMNIAGHAGIAGSTHYITGDAVMIMEEKELREAVRHTAIFARMFPDAKVKVINALKQNREIVAMTGDGVNDGPALKLADVGIAMGKKGTEMARLASDLVLTDDNLEGITAAISEGRKIYNNLLKALRYIISIHIPIILTASLPLIFGWEYPNIFTPVHVIFLELIMGPTCSIFFEREPVEKNSMELPPRSRSVSLFSFNELLISIIQGLAITAGVLTLYYIFMHNHSIEETRTIVFTTLIIANIFLTFSDRSFTKTIFYTIKYKNNLAPILLIISAGFLASLHWIPAVRNLFQLTAITPVDFLTCLGVAFASVLWFELYKSGLAKNVQSKH